MIENPYPPLEESNLPAARKGSLAVRILFWGVSIFAIFIVLSFLAIAARQRSRDIARRVTCINNLKQISLALNNYYDDWDAFPPAYTVDENGNRLHSWRTLILPYADQQALYETIDLSKAWNDPVNAKIFQFPNPFYFCPSRTEAIASNTTTYLAIVGEEFAFRPGRPRKIEEFTDSLNETLLVIEVPEDQAVPWMSPEDADDQTPFDFAPDSKFAHKHNTHVLQVDGSVRSLVVGDLKPQQWRALMTIAGDDDPVEF